MSIYKHEHIASMDLGRAPTSITILSAPRKATFEPLIQLVLKFAERFDLRIFCCSRSPGSDSVHWWLGCIQTIDQLQTRHQALPDLVIRMFSILYLPGSARLSSSCFFHLLGCEYEYRYLVGFTNSLVSPDSPSHAAMQNPSTPTSILPIPTPAGEDYDVTIDEESANKRKVLVTVLGPFFGICVLIIAVSLAIRYWKEKRKQNNVKSATEMVRCSDDASSVPYSPIFSKYSRDIEASPWKLKPARNELT